MKKNVLLDMFDFRGEWESVESNHARFKDYKKKTNQIDYDGFNVNTVCPGIVKINIRVKGCEQRSILRNSGGLSSGLIK